LYLCLVPALFLLVLAVARYFRDTPRVLNGREGDGANSYWYSSLMLEHKRRQLGDAHPLTAHYAMRTVAEWRRWKPRAWRVPADVKEAMKAMPPPNHWLA
jgi:hypothetical protein